MANKRMRLGPGFLVTAAFIGPGTVVAASDSGAEFGFTLIWAVVFSVVATIGLQEMSARVALVGRKGLAEAISSTLPNPTLRFLALALVLVAILFGNCAYQTGNLSGAAAGLSALSSFDAKFWILTISSLVLALIWLGGFKSIQLILTLMVIVMSALFVGAAVMSRPDWTAVACGVIPTSLPSNAIFKIIALIGTTVVPYNLFLHASAILERDENNDLPGGELKQRLRGMRWDTVLSVSIGGLITLAILVTAAQAFKDKPETIKSVSDISKQLQPALGVASSTVFGLGLLAAGLTSAVTAPLAAAYVFAGCLGLPPKLNDRRLKLVATFVLIVGVFFNLYLGASPANIILSAQIANGLLLPLIVLFLLLVVNNRTLMGEYRNRWASNLIGAVVMIVVLAITYRQANQIIEKILPAKVTNGPVGFQQVELYNERAK